jgi:hypothetical protein
MTQLLQPEGPLSRFYWKLAVLAACCPRWYYTICGRPTPSDGLERIYWPSASDTAQDAEGNEVPLPAAARPRMIIDDSASFSFDRDGPDTRIMRAALIVSFEIPAYKSRDFWPSRFWPVDYWPGDFWPTTEVDERDRKTAFMNDVGVLIQQMFAKAETTPGSDDPVDPLGTSHIEIERVDQISPPGLCNPAEWGGNYFAGAVYQFHVRGVL